MRDFRDAKAMARTLRTAMTAKGLKLSSSEALELVARTLGERDWNTLAAAIREAEEAAAKPAPAPAAEPPPPRTERRGRTGQFFSSALEATLHRAVALANTRKHQYTALEHLLVAVLDDPDAAAVFEACAVDVSALRAQATAFIDGELSSLVQEDGPDAVPTAGFHRVIQRSVIHVQSSGREQVTGANVLVAIFSERESHACAFLEQHRINRYDAVNFIAHGVRKDGKAT